MKTLILKVLCPLLLVFIVFYNLDFFIFSFESRKSYLNKRIKKAETEYISLSKKSSSSSGVDQKYSSLKKKLSKLEPAQKSISAEGNIYEMLNACQLKLVSESTLNDRKFKGPLTKLSVGGHYAKVIEFVAMSGKKGFIPVGLEMKIDREDKAIYSISLLSRRSL